MGCVRHPSRTGPLVERVRRLCLDHPETSERLSHGEPAWFFREKKLFVTFAGYHHDERVALWCAAPEGVQGLLVQGAPDRFFVPPYVGRRGWLGVYLDVEVDWAEVAGIIERAYRVISGPARSR